MKHTGDPSPTDVPGDTDRAAQPPQAHDPPVSPTALIPQRRGKCPPQGQTFPLSRGPQPSAGPGHGLQPSEQRRGGPRPWILKLALFRNYHLHRFSHLFAVHRFLSGLPLEEPGPPFPASRLRGSPPQPSPGRPPKACGQAVRRPTVFCREGGAREQRRERVAPEGADERRGQRREGSRRSWEAPPFP